ncbi:MAG: hypothetical protein QOJ51_5065, partial [Acidobacteriaceae bacterium]|nr:hypothetical protein [Acidobacteriaceae bacterium]
LIPADLSRTVPGAGELHAERALNALLVRNKRLALFGPGVAQIVAQVATLKDRLR